MQLAKIQDGKLVIEISLENVKFAFHNSPDNEEFDEDNHVFYSKYRIDNETEFFSELVNRLNDGTSGDGSAPITTFLDQQFQEMIENGDLGIKENEK